MLYLATGAQRTLRVQGAYVSEEEIRRVSDFWRKSGPPCYACLPEFAQALQSGDGRKEKAQEDMREALQLILDRRRISQDLLKAHFRSSARATDLLSLLEVKGFIRKPQGTNRWEIHFDQIDEFFRKN
jgi:S-DNA-T family DNA segregation ATPase FtsK/SpoIIIE